MPIELSDCHGCVDMPEGVTEEHLDAITDYVNDVLGDTTLTVGRVTKPLVGYETWVGEVEIPKIGVNITAILGDEFEMEEIKDIAEMLSRVIRAYYIRTRLYDMIACTGVAN